MSRIDFYRGKATHYLEAAIVHNTTPEDAAAHRTWVLTEPSAMRRVAHMAITHLTTNHPDAVQRILNRPLPEGMSRIGAGARSIVYKDGSSVLKVDTESTLLNEPKRQKMLAKMTEQHHTLRSYLGDIALPSDIFIAPDPLRTSNDAVQIRQPFVAFDSLDHVFTGKTASVNKAALQDVLREHPSLDESFHGFASQGLAMAQVANLAPDTVGRNNIVLQHTGSTPQLRLLDSLPSQTSEKWVNDLILPQLEDLLLYLDPAHTI